MPQFWDAIYGGAKKTAADDIEDFIANGYEIYFSSE